MSALPPTADFQVTAPAEAQRSPGSSHHWHGEFVPDGPARTARWIGWRLRVLVLAALTGCLLLAMLVRVLADVPALPLELQGNDAGILSLTDASGSPRAVRALIDAQGLQTPIDSLLLQRSARWLSSDAERTRHAAQHDALARALALGTLRLQLDEGQVTSIDARPHGVAGLGPMFWLASLLALLLYGVTMVVLMVRPILRNVLFAVMALSQVGNLLVVATESLPLLGWPEGFMRWDVALRSTFDLATAAALVHATGIHPRRLPGSGARTLLAWAVACALATALAATPLPKAWWWTQGVTLAGGLLAVAQLGWVQRLQPHPLAAVLWRFCALMFGTLLLLTLSIAALGEGTARGAQAVMLGASVWVVFVGSMLLLLLPFLARTQQLMREFALLAGVSAVATSLDLLFVAAFSLSNFASLTLALFIALGLYAGLRQWLLNQVMARERVTTERMFEHLYRITRQVQARPQSLSDQLPRLLRQMFEPLELRQLARRSSHARVVGDGASLLVPVPQVAPDATPKVILLGFAQRGARMFTADDARLADRVVDLLARAVEFDQAVERGRSEERVRIAQDLHDDIGARLLTLMYQAPTREMEDYVRHTLKDLKTLTRGLAAANHRLSHAVAEWKADLTQRLAAADCDVGWDFTWDTDLELGIVQWSALTRMLRELVSNTIAHARARRVQIDGVLDSGTLSLTVSDDGCGREPQRWAHGLGLGGVRKRVKQLGGHVQWSEGPHGGIVCRLVVPCQAELPID